LNAFFYRALADAAFLGRLIGEQKTAARYEQAARELAGNINARLWDEPAGAYFAGYLEVPPTNGVSQQRKFSLTVADHLIEPTRHAALFALDQGAVPAERRDRVRQYLLAHPPADNNIMQYYYYFKQQFAADDAGQDVDFLHTLRTQWEDMAESPYEATFEGLHSWGSQAHGYGMFPAYFLSAYVLGVRRDGAVQQKSLLIEPRLAI